MKKIFGLFFFIILVNFTLAQTVEFQVDMGVQAQKAGFNPSTDAVKLAGNFNNWSNGDDVLTDIDGDTVYTITKTFNVGDTLFFKFIRGVDGWENDPNREYIVPAGTSTYFAYFNNDSLYALSGDTIDVTFSCDMEFEIVSGRFNPLTDTMSVRGSFNGWGANDLMFQSVTDPNVWEGTFRIFTFEGDVFNYKYAFFGPNGTTWENDPNKTYTITADDMTFGSAFISRVFNDATLATVTNFPVTIKFTVDMEGAISAINLLPFPSIDDVRICGANAPLRWPAGGWPNADSVLTIKLFDDGTNGDLTSGDNIWSRDITFPQYSPLRIQYKYGANWGLPSNGGGNDNENGVGADHFINLTSDLVSATVENVFGTMGDHPLINIVTDIKDVVYAAPNTYELAQNYPNPFNPSTVIRFGIPEAGFVNLKVYNSLGQEVATLVNDFVNAGGYEVSFDASNLSSGIYFYTITANNFSTTKKMMLVK
ncbi:MAG: T9SS type A sorting domain-containing protein [Ignavibacterium sp.]|nr:T9SS type A sorting domain-containing protein [Ignavibacterium sp.]